MCHTDASMSLQPLGERAGGVGVGGLGGVRNVKQADGPVCHVSPVTHCTPAATIKPSNEVKVADDVCFCLANMKFVGWK